MSNRLTLTLAAWAFGLVTLFAGVLQQKNPPTPPPYAAQPLLVWDVAPAAINGLPRNFRTTRDTIKPDSGPVPDTNGLADLRASASAAFTEANLKVVLARVPGPVTVFDLRQEDHVYVNGQPVSWYATNNWANVGRSHEAIIASEAVRAKTLAHGTVIELADAGARKGDSATAPQRLTVTRAATEREVVISAGASYVRITVSDHARPLDDEVDRFVLAVRALPAEGWVHFHCRAGKGRTTTFIALYDMIRNAKRVSLEDIVNRQSLLLGDYNLLQLGDQTGWKAPLAADRAAFVRAFYDYARANPNGQPQLWTEWLKAQSK